MPTLYVVPGPNGSGESTLTRTARFRGAEIIDPDAIARDTATGTLVEAGRAAVRRRRAALMARRTHLVETTLAGSGVILHMNAARKAGYGIELHYVSLDSPDQTLLRIETRVSQGGHDVPEPDVRRRFDRSLANLPAAIARADEVVLYDNSDPDLPHREVAILAADTWWTAEILPDWAAAALAVPPGR